MQKQLRVAVPETRSIAAREVQCTVQARCGGCPLMTLHSDEQRAAKLEALQHALEARGMVPPDIEFFPSPQPFAYRNRIRLKIEALSGLRFFNPDKIFECAVLEPSLTGRLAEVLRLSRDAPALFAPFAHCEIRSDDDAGRPGLLLAHLPNTTPPDQNTKAIAARLPHFLVGALGDPQLPCQRRSILAGIAALVPLDAFWQINTSVNQQLVTRVRAHAVEHGARTALDLYAGAGNFSLPLASAGLSVLAVERHAAALLALRAAATEQGFACGVRAGDVEAIAQSLLTEAPRFDLVILDPPRAGAARLLEYVLALDAPSIVFCSCNPHSLARDLAVLCRAKYRLRALTALDMFPQTRHVEVIACLTHA